MDGFNAIHKKIWEWEWATDPKMISLMLYLVHHASFKDTRWKGREIKRGQAIIGLRSVSAKTGISMQSLRTCIERLKSTHEITIESTNQYSIVTVCNYSKYNKETDSNQHADQHTNQQTTNKRATNDQQHLNNIISIKENKNRSHLVSPSDDTTTTEEVLEQYFDDNDKPKVDLKTLDPSLLTTPHPVRRGSPVFLSVERYRSIRKRLGVGVLEHQIQALESYAKNKARAFREYSDHASVIDNWHKMKLQKGLRWFTHPAEGPGYYPEWQISKLEDRR